MAPTVHAPQGVIAQAVVAPAFESRVPSSQIKARDNDPCLVRFDARRNRILRAVNCLSRYRAPCSECRKRRIGSAIAAVAAGLSRLLAPCEITAVFPRSQLKWPEKPSALNRHPCFKPENDLIRIPKLIFDDVAR